MRTMSLFTFVVLSIASSAWAAGGITSNGSPGQELLHCQGGFKFSPDNLADVSLSVAPVLGQGLVAKVVFSQEARIPVQVRKVIRKANDPRGTVFEGSKIDILIPAIQVPGRAGHYQAILKMSDLSPFAAILDCSRD